MSLMARLDGGEFMTNEADVFLKEYSDGDKLRLIIEGERFMRTGKGGSFVMDLIDEFGDRHPNLVTSPREMIFPLWLTAAFHRAFDLRNASMFDKDQCGYNSLPDGHDPTASRIGKLVRELDDMERRMLVEDLNHILHVKEEVELLADTIDPPDGIDPGSSQSWAIMLGMAVVVGYALDRRNAIAFDVEKNDYAPGQ